MYDFSSALFWYKFIFMTELLAAEGTFIFLLKEKPNFFARSMISLLLLYAITFALPIVAYNAIFVSVLFSILFVASLAALKLCFKEQWSVLLFVGIWAYSVQHFSYILGNYVTTMVGISNGSFYEGEITAYNAGALLISAASFIVVYFISFLIVKRLFRNISEIRINLFILVILSIISLAIEVVINAYVVYMKVEEYSVTLLTLCYIYDNIACILTVGLLIFSLWNKSIEHDKALMELRFGIERKNFEIRKEKIERINIMCHDLKHRIREIGETGYVGDKIKRLENAIKSYDMTYRTGNDVLDIILTEIGGYCAEDGIQFVCNADGSALSGMPEDHIYSLFDNALNNALEAVRQVKESDKRYIGFQLVKKGGMLSVHVENYFNNDGGLVFKNGVPQTTKEDEEWHGYGMRSIGLIVEKYDGGMSVDIDGDLFCLNIFMPLSEISKDVTNVQ